MANQTEQTFEPNDTQFNPYYGYINDNQDKLDVFWFAFGDYSLLTLKVDDLVKNLSEVYLIPNPASDFFTIENFGDQYKLSEVEIYNVLGEKQVVKVEQNRINIQQFDEGVYYIKFPDSSRLVKFNIQ